MSTFLEISKFPGHSGDMPSDPEQSSRGIHTGIALAKARHRAGDVVRLPPDVHSIWKKGDFCLLHRPSRRHLGCSRRLAPTKAFRSVGRPEDFCLTLHYAVLTATPVKFSAELPITKNRQDVELLCLLSGFWLSQPRKRLSCNGNEHPAWAASSLGSTRNRSM